MFSLDQIHAGLAGHAPNQAQDSPAADGSAAVALVLAGRQDNLSLCFIRRAEHPADPWSGHMALPGGRTDEADANARYAAMRETVEEVGVHLGESHYLGSLGNMPINARFPERRLNTLSSFVFYRGESLPDLTPEPNEVADAYWVDLKYLWDSGNRTHVEWREQKYPGIAYRQQIIWGLTWRVLNQFGEMLSRPLPT